MFQRAYNDQTENFAKDRFQHSPWLVREWKETEFHQTIQFMNKKCVLLAFTATERSI